MVNNAKTMRCDLCGKIIVIDDAEGPLRQPFINVEKIKNVWMPNMNTHVCISCKRKYVRGGGVAKDWRKPDA